MYIAGLHSDFTHFLHKLPLSHEQGIESIAWLTTAGGIFLACGLHHHASRQAKLESGPTTKALTASLKHHEKCASPIAALSIFGPPHVYLIGTALNRMFQPEWFKKFALPGFYPVGKSAVACVASVRTLACVVNVGAWYLAYKSFKNLGSQWHWMGVREKSKVVDSGPYAIIRHPLYAAFLLCEATYALMWWNYVPLVGLAVTAVSLAIKIPAEERLREQDPNSGAEYAVYTRKVPYKLIPGIW